MKQSNGYHVLDMCCGGKMFYYEKDCPEVLYQDVREGEFEYPENRILKVHPTLIGDFTQMANIPSGEGEEGYSLVVFDPPHLVQAGEKSFLRIKYGVLPKEWKETIRKGFENGFRILKDDGVLLFKWSGIQLNHSDVLKLSPYKPLLGDRRGKTRWTVFIKSECLKRER